jgi:hypothetical protein
MENEFFGLGEKKMEKVLEFLKEDLKFKKSERDEKISVNTYFVAKTLSSAN